MMPFYLWIFPAQLPKRVSAQIRALRFCMPYRRA